MAAQAYRAARARSLGATRSAWRLLPLVLLGLAVLAAAPAAFAREAPAETPAGEVQPPPGPVDEYERGVPRSAVRGYLVACREGDFERAAEYLDLRRIPEQQRATQGPELARQLKVVLDRSLWVDVDALSNSAEGVSGDGLAWHRDLVGTIASREGTINIFVDRVPRADGVRIWQISGSSVAEIPDLYTEFGHGRLEQMLPQILLDVQVADLALWQWIALLLAIGLAYFLSVLAASGFLALARSLVRRSSTAVDDHILDAASGPLRLVLGVLVFHALRLPLALTVPAERLLSGTERTLGIFAFAWLLFRLIEVFSRHYQDRLVARGNVPAAHVVPLGSKAVKALIAVAAVLAALDNFGFNVMALIAGLGVGGIAVALAAQKTIENLFGGITLIADRPVRPGDFCRFGDRIGTVEEIGLRSTRVRTLDRTIVTVPNAEFSTLQLENFAERDQIRFHTVLGLRYETGSDQLRHVLAAIRRLLLSHPRVSADPARVRFVEFGAYSLDLEIFAYVRTADWNEFLAIREDLLLRLMDIVEKSGTGFAFPSATHYVARDEGVDMEKARLAAEEIRALREQNALPLPDYGEDTKAELLGSLEYPPQGSVLRRK